MCRNRIGQKKSLEKPFPLSGHLTEERHPVFIQKVQKYSDERKDEKIFSSGTNIAKDGLLGSEDGFAVASYSSLLSNSQDGISLDESNCSNINQELQNKNSCDATSNGISILADKKHVITEVEKHIWYKLRAFSVISFPGNKNEESDIKQSSFPPDAEFDISSVSQEFIFEFLQYLIQCGARLSQMTKTYDDKDALISLLREKEEDLELAARIGQSLLEKNKKLQEKNEVAERDLSASLEMVTQLKHELSVKDKILKLYTQESDTESDPGISSGTMGFSANLEALNRKVSSLEEENLHLKTKTFIHADCLREFEEREKQLVDACVKEMSELNEQLSLTQKERIEIEDEVRKKEEEIADLLAKIEDLNNNIEKLNQENAILQFKLEKAVECQQVIATELIEFQGKYQKLLAAFQELQNETKKTERNHAPSVKKWTHGFDNTDSCLDSLASELELSLHSSFPPLEERSFHRRVFETVRCANKAAYDHCNTDGRSSGYPLFFGQFQPQSQMDSSSSSLNENSDTESAYGESYQTDDDSQYSSLGSIGVPGTPGSLDLEVSLRRLATTGAESSVPVEYSVSTCHDSHSFYSSMSPSTIVKHYKLPDKLQIIKPLEGSQTLQHWQELAIPHLGRIFEQRSGIQVKGEKKMPFLDEVYSLSDVEEDEEIQFPGKSFEDTTSVYTYVTSSVQNSSGQTNVTPRTSDHSSLKFCSLASDKSAQPFACQKTLEFSKEEDFDLSHFDSYSSVKMSSFSTHASLPLEYSPQAKDNSTPPLNLNKVLSEHGIHGVVPSKDAAQTHEIPPTPPPSPQKSRPSSPELFDPLNLPDLIKHQQISKGYHLLKSPSKSFSNEKSVSSETTSPNQFAIGLMDKLNKIGLKNIINTSSHLVLDSFASSNISVLTKNSSVKFNTLPDDMPLTAYTKETSVDKSCERFSLVNDSTGEEIERQAFSSRSPALHHPWGVVPMLKVGRGLPLALSPPLSCMPNPILQLNSFSCLRFGSTPDVGTLKSLHILRKGGYA